jgi:hypothetical protein
VTIQPRGPSALPAVADTFGEYSSTLRSSFRFLRGTYEQGSDSRPAAMAGFLVDLEQRGADQVLSSLRPPTPGVSLNGNIWFPVPFIDKHVYERLSIV